MVGAAFRVLRATVVRSSVHYRKPSPIAGISSSSSRTAAPTTLQPPLTRRPATDPDSDAPHGCTSEPHSHAPLPLRVPTALPSTVNANPPPFDTTDPSAQVQCLSRARIPTPHGSAFLHLYRNNVDNKEHLALVVDHAEEIRSRSLDAVWSPAESEMDRIVRGAQVGAAAKTPSAADVSPPLVRIHSECFTGETVGSMRCDCGEQLDEALRLISSGGRGAVVYLRQEGRGIGLLAKLRAYNLQDQGHDTVSANLLLGHGADERGYAVASAILRDLDLPEVRILTNNPEKVRALQAEGVGISDRVGMVPRAWQDRTREQTNAPGATLIGGGAAYGEDLEKYMRTKVDRMGHMLTLPSQ